jgi:DNA-binding beta-propeller fold protein YncE
MAVSRDGTTLLVAGMSVVSGSLMIHVFSVADGSWLRAVGGKGSGLPQFRCQYQVWVAPDGVVFVADFGNDRVLVLTPTLDFHGFVGVWNSAPPVWCMCQCRRRRGVRAVANASHQCVQPRW